MVEIIPGILEKDLSDLTHKVSLVTGLVDWVQIDFADNTLVPNETFRGFDELTRLIRKYPNLSFEAHLMVDYPEKYIRPLVDSGFTRLIAHVEANDPRKFLDDVSYESVEAALAIDGATELEQLEPFLDAVDAVLVMTIEAGFSGSPFLPETVEKIKVIHQNLPDLPIEVDGGMNEATVKLVKEAGATRIVSTSYLFKNPQAIGEAIQRLKDT